MTVSTYVGPVDSVNRAGRLALVRTTRDQLVHVAVQLLDEGGPAAVTLREVGRRSGVSHNAPYRHFEDKEELLAAVAARELRKQARAESGRDARAPIAALRRRMDAYIRWATRYPARFKLTFGPWSRAWPELGEAAQEARVVVVGLVSAAQQSGDLPPGQPERVAALILATAHGAVDLALAGHLSPSGRGKASPVGLVEDLFRALANEKTGGVAGLEVGGRVS